MINAFEKKKWIQDLRSGKFIQGQRLFFNPLTKCYCVLGVLASQFVSSEDKLRTINFQFIDQLLPYMFARELSWANDAGESFATLADIIEKKDLNA